MIWRTHEFVIFLIALAAFIAAIEIGYRLGRRRQDSGKDSSDHNGALVAGALGLLALLLGFTFAMAVNRFDRRQDLVVDEANSINETYRRGRLLPSPYRDRLPELMRGYMRERLDFFHAGIDRKRLADAQASAAAILDQLWVLADSASARDPHAMVPALFVESLNAMDADREARQAAFDNHVPELAILLLLGVSVASMGFVGYGTGLTGRRRPLSGGLFCLMIAMALIIILDLDRPRRGITKVDQAALLRVNEMLQQATP
jgi:hypothetical protein